MALRVTVPPAPILVPTDISPSYDVGDPKIIALIAAATGEIDGPDGWLGRAIGPQTIEMVTSEPQFLGRYCEIWLPCPPIIGITSLIYLDRDRVAHTVDPDNYELTAFGLRWSVWPDPFVARQFDDALKITYLAGYNGTSIAEGGTGDIPAVIKQAVVFSVQQLSALSAENLFLASETVEGIGQTSYIVSPNSELLIRNVMDRLLGGMRVFR